MPVFSMQGSVTAFMASGSAAPTPIPTSTPASASVPVGIDGGAGAATSGGGAAAAASEVQAAGDNPYLPPKEAMGSSRWAVIGRFGNGCWAVRQRLLRRLGRLGTAGGRGGEDLLAFCLASHAHEIGCIKREGRSSASCI